MKKLINILIFIIIPFMVLSQTAVEPKPKKMFFGLNLGVNMCKLHSDTIDFNFGYRPYLGINGRYNINEKLSLKSTILYSLKTSASTDPYAKFNTEYIDINFTTQYAFFDDIIFQGGIVYSSFLSSTKHLNENVSLFKVDRESISGYKSEFNLLAGLEIRLYDNITFELNYAIPLKSTNNTNIQLGINILLFNRYNEKHNYDKVKRNESVDQIVKLKESVLLVRLKPYSPKNAPLIKIGGEKKTEKAELNQNEVNKQIVKAFKENFDFCEVRFFYANKSINIYENRLENMFLNDNLKIDKSIIVDADKGFFIAEFDNIKEDTMSYFSHHTYKQNDTNELEVVDNYYSVPSKANYYALKIMDRNFVQLKSPFPYNVKVNKPIVLKSTYNQTITRMNNKLKAYFILK